ncbi:MAG: hypothetical protein HFF08_08000 [Oscillospiraceae bacterium]|nr:hypothetical protein [Oscillospiraceae bacterium]
MANLFPGSPPGFDGDDLPGTVRRLCASLRSLYENAGLQLSYTQKVAAEMETRVRTLEKTFHDVTQN